ncbi:MAG: homocysteine biosynthesis protein [Candidatus Jordarchaeaceae archaeon]
MSPITSNTTKTYEEINEKIKKGDAVVVTAEEMVKIVEEQGEKKAAKEIDVVTTGTFGAMCSSGAFLNFGHSDPPIKMEQLWLNDVEAYHGNAAVDCYIGVTKMSTIKPFKYGGGHVIEDLVGGKEITLRARAYGTDCYPRTSLETTFNIEDLNQAILCNPRNAYQRYNAATNGRDETIYTYMGKLLANYGNVTYSGSGCLSPLYNDPDYETIGIGTRIFLGGGVGYVIGEGTQHNPRNHFGTIMVKGDLKQMSPEYLKGAAFTKYGTTMYVGLGIPIPILNEGLARKTAISDADITTEVVDYGVPRRNRPSLKKVTYQELKSGRIELNGKTVKVSSLSSLKMARRVAQTLKKWIEEGRFLLSKPVETLPTTSEFKPMKITKEIQYVRSIMIPAVTTTTEASIHEVAKLIVEKNVNHIVVVDKEKTLKGIVTSFDITRAVANNKEKLEEIVVRRVYTAKPDDPLDAVVKELETHKISALPVIDEKKKVLGIVTSEEISKLVAK